MKILAFADLHAHKPSMQELIKKGKNADIIVAAGDLSIFGYKLDIVMKFLSSFHQQVLVVHGNHETEEEIQQYHYPNIHFIHGSAWEHEGFLFLGWGGGGFALTDEEFEKRAYKDFLHYPNTKKIFITHQPPYGTVLDNLYGRSVGNKSFRSFIKQVKPILAISGHIHETAKKTGHLGNTYLVNPGHTGMLLTVI